MVRRNGLLWRLRVVAKTGLPGFVLIIAWLRPRGTLRALRPPEAAPVVAAVFLSVGPLFRTLRLCSFRRCPLVLRGLCGGLRLGALLRILPAAAVAPVASPAAAGTALSVTPVASPSVASAARKAAVAFVGIVYGAFAQMLGDRQFFHIPLHESFDAVELALLLFADEGDRAARCARARRASDAVDVVLRVVRYVVVDHRADIFDVDPARDDVRRYEPGRFCRF